MKSHCIPLLSVSVLCLSCATIQTPAGGRLVETGLPAFDASKMKDADIAISFDASTNSPGLLPLLFIDGNTLFSVGGRLALQGFDLDAGVSASLGACYGMGRSAGYSISSSAIAPDEGSFTVASAFLRLGLARSWQGSLYLPAVQLSYSWEGGPYFDYRALADVGMDMFIFSAPDINLKDERARWMLSLIALDMNTPVGDGDAVRVSTELGWSDQKEDQIRYAFGSWDKRATSVGETLLSFALIPIPANVACRVAWRSKTGFYAGASLDLGMFVPSLTAFTGLAL